MALASLGISLLLLPLLASAAYCRYRKRRSQRHSQYLSDDTLDARDGHARGKHATSKLDPSLLKGPDGQPTRKLHSQATERVRAEARRTRPDDDDDATGSAGANGSGSNDHDANESIRGPPSSRTGAKGGRSVGFALLGARPQSTPLLRTFPASDVGSSSALDQTRAGRSQRFQQQRSKDLRRSSFARCCAVRSAIASRAQPVDSRVIDQQSLADLGSSRVQSGRSQKAPAKLRKVGSSETGLPGKLRKARSAEPDVEREQPGKLMSMAI